MPRTIAVVLFTTLLVAGPVRAQSADPDWSEDVARFAQRLVDVGITPGMGVAVSQGDRVVWAAGFGMADADARRRADETTYFYLASSTKALTATAVVLKAARGEIDLDAPIERYLPGLHFGPPLANTVTIADLLSMSDGIEAGGPVVTRTAYTGDFTPELLVELLSAYGPAENGTAFEYDNLPFNVLGLVLSPDDRDGWKEVVAREVQEPLGMEETSARLSTLDPERIAMPHSIVAGQGWKRIRLGKADANLHAAGGHYATPRDVARFVAAHASGGILEGERVFPEAPIQSTHEPHTTQDRDFGPFHRYAWGYGWDLATWKERTIVHRFGGFEGYRSHVSFEPESRIGAVVLVNGGGTASSGADLVATYIYDRILAGTDWPASDLESAYEQSLSQLLLRKAAAEQEMAAGIERRRALQVPLSHPLEAYAGTYESEKLGTMTWRVRADGLEVVMGVAESPAEVLDATKDELRVELMGGGDAVAFEFPPGGGPATALVVQGERFARVGP